ncbi:MAG: YbjN domain-containing protein [Pirellulaceae bacterium]
MNLAYERLVQHLDNRDVRYRAHDDAGVICVDFQGDVGTYRVVASVDKDGELFEVLGCAPVRVPEGARPSIAETIVRANYGLRIGKWEMDYEDGEIRYQVAHSLVEGLLEESIIARSFGAVMAALDRYLPAVLSVIYGNELPRDAIRSAEHSDVSDAE